MTNARAPNNGSTLNESMRVTPATGAGKSLVRSQAPKKVLVVHPVARERMSLIKILRGCGYQMECGAELATAFGALDDISVVMCAASLADGSWRDLLARIGLIAHPPLVIVTSRVADDRLWAEVLSLGAHDLLAEPFCEEEVVRVVDLAWQRWYCDL